MMEKYKVGDKVVFTDQEAHERCPQFYPNPGTVGEVIRVDNSRGLLVQWPKGTTSMTDEWACCVERVKPYDEEEIMETKRSPLAKALGVEEDEVFTVPTKDIGEFRIHHGNRQHKRYPEEEWDEYCSEENLTILINNPGLIKRKPKYDHDTIEDAKAVMRLFWPDGWVARDKDKALWVYNQEPKYKTDRAFILCEGFSQTELSKRLFPCITFENSPVKLSEIVEADNG